LVEVRSTRGGGGGGDPVFFRRGNTRRQGGKYMNGTTKMNTKKGKLLGDRECFAE